MIAFLLACGHPPDKEHRDSASRDTHDTGSNDTHGRDSGPDDTSDTSVVDEDDDGWSPDAGDCNDLDATVNPAAEEVRGDGVDQDCDGSLLLLAGVASDLAAARFTGDVENSVAGCGLAVVPDVTGDGVADVLVGAPEGTTKLTFEVGRAYVVPGPWTGALDPGDAAATIETQDSWDEFGLAVDSPGDLDGDGYPELWFPNKGFRENGDGQVDVFLPPVSGDLVTSEADLHFGAASNWVEYYAIGTTIVTLDDGLWGMVAYDTDDWPPTMLLTTTVPFDGMLLDDVADVALTGDLMVTATGDVNGDGISDLAIGGVSMEPSLPTFSVLPGPLDASGATTTMGANWASTASVAWWGVSVAMSDLDGDGRDDVVAGVRGSVQILYGQDELSGTSVLENARTRVVGDSALGQMVAVLGDIDGDGTTDVGLGDALWTYAWLGPFEDGTFDTEDLDAAWYSDTDQAYKPVVGGPDWNDDGISEIFIGNYAESTAETPYAGVTYMLEGLPP